jgi:hypothetical protein
VRLHTAVVACGDGVLEHPRDAPPTFGIGLSVFGIFSAGIGNGVKTEAPCWVPSSCAP